MDSPRTFDQLVAKIATMDYAASSRGGDTKFRRLTIAMSQKGWNASVLGGCFSHTGTGQTVEAALVSVLCDIDGKKRAMRKEFASKRGSG